MSSTRLSLIALALSSSLLMTGCQLDDLMALLPDTQLPHADEDKHNNGDQLTTEPEPTPENPNEPESPEPTTPDEPEPEPEPQEPETPTPAPLSNLEKALKDGDVRDVTWTRLLDEIGHQIEITYSNQQASDTKLFSRDGSYGAEVDTLDWKLPTKSTWLYSQDVGAHTAVLQSNYNHSDGSSVNPRLLALRSSDPAKPYMLFATNPMSRESVVNDAMHQFLKNAIQDFIGLEDIDNTPFNVTVANLFESRNHPQDTVAWLEQNTSAVINNGGTFNSCNNQNLSLCLDNSDLLIFDTAYNPADFPRTELVKVVIEANNRGLPVIWMSSAMGSSNEYSAPLRPHFHFTQTNNYKVRAGLRDYSGQSDHYAPIKHFTKLHDTLKNETLDVSEYTDCFGKGRLRECGNSALNSKLYTPLNFLRDKLQTIVSNREVLFRDYGYRMEKLFTLLGDRVRIGGTEIPAIEYPIQTKTDAQLLARSLLADYSVVILRDQAPAQSDLGTFANCGKSGWDMSGCTTYDHTQVPRTNIAFSIPMREFNHWVPTGAYALPGEPFQITRTDNVQTNLHVKVNFQKSRSTRSAQNGGYNRPLYSRSQSYLLKPGEPVTLTSPYGGPVYVSYASNKEQQGEVISVSVNNIAEYPVLRNMDNIAELDKFIDDARTTILPHVDIDDPDVAIHAKKANMLGALNGSWKDKPREYFFAFRDGTINTIYDLAGLKQHGKDLVDILSLDVKTICANFGWDCTNNNIHKRGRVEHINYDTYSSCGSGCAGNPIEAGVTMHPYARLISHELGHNLQDQKLNLGSYKNRDATWNKWSNESREVSTEIFPLYVDWRYKRFELGQEEPLKESTRFMTKTKFSVFQSAYDDRMIKDGRRHIYNDSCALVGEYDADMAPADIIATHTPHHHATYYSIAMLAADLVMADGTKLENGFEIYTLLYMQKRLMNLADNNSASWLEKRDNLGFGLFPYSGHEVYGGKNIQGISGNDFLTVALAKITGKDWRPFFTRHGIQFSSLASAQVDDLLGDNPEEMNQWIATSSYTIPWKDMSTTVPNHYQKFSVEDPTAAWPFDDFHPYGCMQ